MKKQRLATCQPGSRPVKLFRKEMARWARKLAQQPQPVRRLAVKEAQGRDRL
jgi:hypothetical protein